MRSLQKKPEVTSYLQDIGGHLIRALLDLEKELGPAVEAGLISKESVSEKSEELVKRIETDPNASLAAKYLGYIAVSEGRNIDQGEVDFQESTEKQPEPEIKTEPIIQLKLTYSNGAIVIGKNGKYIKTSNKTIETQRDYGPDRIKLLEVLINDDTGDFVKVTDLRRLAFGEQDVDNNALSQIRKWLDKLNFRRQPLIIHNGKRGKGSAYKVNPKMALQLVKQEVIERQQQDTITIQPETDEQKIYETAPEVIRVPRSIFPLSRYESSVLATFLEMNNDLLEQIGLDKISEETFGRNYG